MGRSDGPNPLAVLVAGCAALTAVLLPVAALIAVVRLLVWLVVG